MPVSRRTFVEGTAALLAAVGLPAWAIAELNTHGELSPLARHIFQPPSVAPDAAAVHVLLTATVELLRASVPPDQQATFGDTLAGDTQAILAWVKENNPKQYIKEGRLDKTRQPQGDPDCTLSVKACHNTPPAEQAPPTPITNARPATRLQVGVDVLWT